MLARVRSLGAIAAASNGERLLWAVRVRWLAIGGFSALALAAWSSGLLVSLHPCLVAGGLSAAVNAANHWCVRRWRCVRAVTALAIPADVLLTSYLVLHTGGVQSPFVMIYVVLVVANAMLVDLGVAAVTAVASAACFVAALSAGVGAAPLPALDRPAYQLIWSLFLLYSLALLTYLGGYIAARLRRSEDDLAERNAHLRGALASLGEANGELRRTVVRLRATETQLRQSEKMRALGQFVAGVAHELNNPIGFISANLEHLERCSAAMQRLLVAYAAAPLDPATRESLAAERRLLRLDGLLEDLPAALADCAEGARRAAEIVGGLRAFARGDGGVWSRADLRLHLDRTLVLLRHRIGVEVGLSCDYGEVPPIECLPGQLDQVWLNILSNAADAVGQRGTITIRTRLEADPPAGRRAGSHAVVSIQDDGGGMSAETRARVFDPFFTTKPEGQGTGLGLSVSYGIVERHGGAITVDSAPGSGSTFTVYLPLERSETAPVAED
jgi:signal transduction histidine kinase